VRTTRFSLVCVGLDCALSWIGEVSGSYGSVLFFVFLRGPLFLSRLLSAYFCLGFWGSVSWRSPWLLVCVGFPAMDTVLGRLWFFSVSFTCSRACSGVSLLVRGLPGSFGARNYKH